MNHIEYEVRVLDIDKDEMIKKLNDLGATLVEDSYQSRYVYDFNPVNPSKWIRLRTNGSKSTLTIKSIEDKTIDGTKELEVEVSSFEDTNLILNELGYKSKGFQENKRIKFDYKGIEVDIDSWPMIPTYLEIEGKSENEVYEMLDILGIDKKDTTTSDVQSIYEEVYGIDIKKRPNLSFDVENKK